VSHLAVAILFWLWPGSEFGIFVNIADDLVLFFLLVGLVGFPYQDIPFYTLLNKKDK